jgi:hypothetical protein
LLATDRARYLRSACHPLTPSHSWLIAPVLLLSEAFAQHAQVQPGKAQVILTRSVAPSNSIRWTCVKNVFKFNPLLFFRGEIPIYYERASLTNSASNSASGSPCGIIWPCPSPAMMPMTMGPAPRSSPILSYHVGAHLFRARPGATRILCAAGLRAPGLQQGYLGALRMAPSPRRSTVTNERTTTSASCRLPAAQASSNWLFDVYGGVA